MLPSKKRLDRPLFKNFLSLEGKKTVFNSLGTLKYQNNTKDTRFSVVISSKVEKRATHRNLLKRRLYSILGDFLKTNNIKIQGVFYLSKNSTKFSFEEFKKNIDELLKKATK